MCNCVKELEKKLVGTEWKKKKILKSEYVSGAIIFSSPVRFQTTGEAEVEVEGGKKKLVVPIVHSHCPFCGEKYPQ